MNIILAIFLIVFVLMFMTNTKKQENPCKNGHKWVYKKQPDNPQMEYLVCTRCGQFPGESGYEERH
jgi:hypothetical protein